MIFLSTILFSCKEEPPLRSDDGIRITNSIQNPDLQLLDSIDIIHNETLFHLDEYLSQNFNSCSSGDFLSFNNTMSSFMLSNYGFSTTATQIPNNLKDILLDNCDDLDEMIQELKNDAISGINSSTFSQYCSSYERNIVLNAINFMTDTTNFSGCTDAFEALSKIDDYADSTINLINNMTMNDSLDKTFGLICLKTLKGSAQFWTNYIEETSSIQMKMGADKEIQLLPILAAYLIYKTTKIVSGDLIGAACGYWGGVTIEVVATGELKNENRRMRIATAAGGAVSGSMYAGLTP